MSADYQIISVPNIMSVGLCLKKFTPLMLARLLDKLIASKLALFLVPGLKDEKLIKKQTCMKTETCKLNYRGFLDISAKCHQI